VSDSKDLEETEGIPFSTSTFLKDVFMCSLVAFGGPEAHLGVFLERLVKKKKYLTEKSLMEWMALCSFLPGPTSTQVITGIGLEKGGRRLASLTLLVWAMPMIIVMGALSFLPYGLGSDGRWPDWLSFLVPMAGGFIAWATWQIGKKVVSDLLTLALWGQGFAVVLLANSPWAIPLILASGGLLAAILGKAPEKGGDSEFSLTRIPWGLFMLFGAFERFYRFGYLVFGGGQVVVPVMQQELVDHGEFLTTDQFLGGFGLVQALPGPMFSFAAYAGGLSEVAGGSGRQVLGAAISGLAIFLPGTLLLFFVYPIWGRLRNLTWAGKALNGLNATAGGLVGGALVQVVLVLAEVPSSLGYLLLTVACLSVRKLPAPFIVVLLGVLSFAFGQL
jgi:chromate transporter